jgi:hypothetical protein
MKAIVLLRVTRGEVERVYYGLRRLETVSECCMSYGRYDAAAITQAESLEELWQIIDGQIAELRGVTGAFPCLLEEEASLRNPPEHVREFVSIAS